MKEKILQGRKLFMHLDIPARQQTLSRTLLLLFHFKSLVINSPCSPARPSQHISCIRMHTTLHIKMHYSRHPNKAIRFSLHESNQQINCLCQLITHLSSSSSFSLVIASAILFPPQLTHYTEQFQRKRFCLYQL